MVEAFKNLTSWLTTSGTKIVGILIGLLILSQIGEELGRKNLIRVPSWNPLRPWE